MCMSLLESCSIPAAPSIFLPAPLPESGVAVDSAPPPAEPPNLHDLIHVLHHLEGDRFHSSSARVTAVNLPIDHN